MTQPTPEQHQTLSEFQNLPWRWDEKITTVDDQGDTLWLIICHDAEGNPMLVGEATFPELAAEIVESHNRGLAISSPSTGEGQDTEARRWQDVELRELLGKHGIAVDASKAVTADMLRDLVESKHENMTEAHAEILRLQSTLTQTHHELEQAQQERDEFSELYDEERRRARKHQVRRSELERLSQELSTLRARLPQWISVEERLPDYYQVVMVNHNEVVTAGYWNGDMWKLAYTSTPTHGTTHWQPVPPLPPSSPATAAGEEVEAEQEATDER